MPTETKILTSVSGEDVVQLLREEGYGPELAADADGEPMVRFKLEGLKCLVLFYNVKDGRSDSLQFHSGFRHKIPMEKINEWNARKRVPKVYLDRDGELNLSMEVELDGGVTRDNLAAQFRIWRSLFGPCLRFLME